MSNIERALAGEGYNLVPQQETKPVKTPNLAIQMIAGFFGGKLDAFFGYAAAKQRGYRGPTPSRKSRVEDRKAIALMKIKPFHKRDGYAQKLLSNRDLHRLAVKYEPRLTGKPVSIATAVFLA